tara:strand:+ start:61 stop:588 length:528 start_codon:yes stop_codon:yes gene_type:complete
MGNLIDQTVKVALSLFLISLSLLIVSMMMPDSEKKDYAYINFDGGYAALGYISGIKYEMNVSMKDDEGTVYASGKEEVLDVLRDFREGTRIKEGIFLEFDNSYFYSGSVSNFTLTINTRKLYSDGTTPPKNWIINIEAVEQKEKGDYRREALSHLYFESAPGGENPLAFIKNLFN